MANQTDRTARAAAIRQAQDRSERNRKLALVVGVILALAVIFGMVYWQTRSASTPTTDLPKVATSAGDHSLLMGEASAPMKVVVYEDFLCPYCREFEVSSRDYLLTAAQKGKVQVEFRPFHLLKDDQDYSLNTLNAFAAILASDPAKALAFHNLAFDEQPYENQPSKPTVADLTKWAKQVGVGSDVTGSFDTIDQTWVDAAGKAAVDNKIQGTPSVFVDGKKLEGASIQEMSDSLESMIAKLK